MPDRPDAPLEYQRRLETMRERQTAFAAVFNGPRAEQVMDFLASFCRANEPCFRPDAREHALLEGRREVYLTIQRYLTLNPEELVAYYHRNPQ